MESNHHASRSTAANGFKVQLASDEKCFQHAELYLEIHIEMNICTVFYVEYQLVSAI